MPYSITIGDRDKVLRTSTIYFLKVFNSEREFDLAREGESRIVKI